MGLQATCNAQPSSVQSAAEALLSYFPSNLHTKILLADIQQVIQQFLDVSGTVCQTIDLMASKSCTQFGVKLNVSLAGFEAIDASLSVITTTSCPRFHADHVQLRCLCTYLGPGTYFVPNKAVNRRQWMRALGIQNTNGFGVKSQSSVQQASAWDIVILKGNSFPGNQGTVSCLSIPKLCRKDCCLILHIGNGMQHHCAIAVCTLLFQSRLALLS